MATIYNQYLTKLIVQLLNEYGHHGSSDEKKIQRDTLIGKINKFANQAENFIDDEHFHKQLLEIINTSRQEALNIAAKTSGISTGGLEKYCDCATYLIDESYKLFSSNELTDINTHELISDLENQKNRFKFIYILVRRVLLEYNIYKVKLEALRTNGLDSYGYWQEYAKSYIPNVNIDAAKKETLQKRTELLKNSVLYALEREITPQEMKGALDTISDQLRIMLDELRKTHGSKTLGFSDSLSALTMASAAVSMFVSPKDGESENIVLFLKDCLLPTLVKPDYFKDADKNELASMLSCHYRRIKGFLQKSVTTLTDGKIDVSSYSTSQKETAETQLDEIMDNELKTDTPESTSQQEPKIDPQYLKVNNGDSATAPKHKAKNRPRQGAMH